MTLPASATTARLNSAQRPGCVGWSSCNSGTQHILSRHVAGQDKGVSTLLKEYMRTLNLSMGKRKRSPASSPGRSARPTDPSWAPSLALASSAPGKTRSDQTPSAPTTVPGTQADSPAWQSCIHQSRFHLLQTIAVGPCWHGDSLLDSLASCRFPRERGGVYGAPLLLQGPAQAQALQGCAPGL